MEHLFLMVLLSVASKSLLNNEILETKYPVRGFASCFADEWSHPVTQPATPDGIFLMGNEKRGSGGRSLRMARQGGGPPRGGRLRPARLSEPHSETE